MAIDTAIKRASMANEFTLVRMPDPDGAWNASDRAIFNWLYSGMDDLTPPAPPATVEQAVFNLGAWGRSRAVREAFKLNRIVQILNTRVQCV